MSPQTMMLGIALMVGTMIATACSCGSENGQQQQTTQKQTYDVTPSLNAVFSAFPDATEVCMDSVWNSSKDKTEWTILVQMSRGNGDKYNIGWNSMETWSFKDLSNGTRFLPESSTSFVSVPEFDKTNIVCKTR